MGDIWRFLWWFSETFHIPLGKYAPFVFGKTIGRKANKMKGVNNDSAKF